MRRAWEPVRPRTDSSAHFRPTYSRSTTVLHSGPIPSGPVGRVLLVVVVAAGLVLLGRCTGPEPEPRHPEVIVPEESITDDEPRLDRSIGDRLRKRNVKPVQIATAPRGGDDELRAFCSAQVARAVAGGPAVGGPEIDTAPPVPAPKTIFLARSSRTEPGMWWRKSTTTVVGPLSTGGLREIRFRHYPGAQWRSDDAGGIAIQENRLGWVRGAAEFLVPVGVGAIATLGICAATGC